MRIEKKEIFNTKEVDLNEFERQLNISIFEVELEFLRRLKIETGLGMEELFDKYSNIFDFFAHGIEVNDYNKELLEQIRSELRSNILKLENVSSEQWVSKALNEIRNSYKKIDQQVEYTESQEEPHLGSFVYNLGEVREAEDKNFNLKEGDSYLQLHFPINVIEKLKAKLNLGLKDSLQEVAKFIINNHPEVQAVVGASWLMSHPLAKKLGFEIVKRESADKSFKQPGYWLQLIDAEGNIKKDAAEFLYKNKRLPYDFSYGKINTEDFLERYLPEDLRKKDIILKKVRPEYLDKMHKIKSEWSLFESHWDKFTQKDLLDNLYSQAPHFVDLLKKAGVLDDFIFKIKQLKEQGVASTVLNKILESEEFSKPLVGYIDNNLKYSEERKII